jgi:hypothetical protein
MNFLASKHTVQDFFGKITPPPGTPNVADPQTGLVRMINVGMSGLMTVAALYTLLNLVLAGFNYVTSSGDSKKTAEANQRITYSVVGLAIIVVTPLIAAVLGVVAFGRWDAILNPQITTIQDTVTP